MSINMFVKKENVQMLWDVISDEDIFKFLSPTIQNNIYSLFLNNIPGFYETEKMKTNNLVELNKKFMLLILNYIKKTYPHQPNKIKIYNETPVKELITFEEIHNDRKSQFERDVNRRQEEFEDYMAIKAPPVPEFSDKTSDHPIKDMDKMLKEMQARRNYEVEQINQSYNNNNASNIEQLLKPQETSLKTEKYDYKKDEPTGTRFKYLNDLQPKKSVSFNNNDEINTFLEQEVDEEDVNIFSKLKKINNMQYDEEQFIKRDNITGTIVDKHLNSFNPHEERLDKLERNVELLHQKLDTLFQLLNK